MEECEWFECVAKYTYRGGAQSSTTSDELGFLCELPDRPIVLVSPSIPIEIGDEVEVKIRLPSVADFGPGEISPHTLIQDCCESLKQRRQGCLSRIEE